MSIYSRRNPIPWYENFNNFYLYSLPGLLLRCATCSFCIHGQNDHFETHVSLSASRPPPVRSGWTARKKPTSISSYLLWKSKTGPEIARKRLNTAQYVPLSVAAAAGADGSVGGLGTKDTINSGPVHCRLSRRRKIKKALRAILAEATGEAQHEGPILKIINNPNIRNRCIEARRREAPWCWHHHVATLEDYACVPVSQFGVTLLRGMRWKQGTVVYRKAWWNPTFHQHAQLSWVLARRTRPERNSHEIRGDTSCHENQITDQHRRTVLQSHPSLPQLVICDRIS